MRRIAVVLLLLGALAIAACSSNESIDSSSPEGAGPEQEAWSEYVLDEDVTFSHPAGWEYWTDGATGIHYAGLRDGEEYLGLYWYDIHDGYDDARFEELVDATNVHNLARDDVEEFEPLVPRSIVDGAKRCYESANMLETNGKRGRYLMLLTEDGRVVTLGYVETANAPSADWDLGMRALKTLTVEVKD